MPHPMLQSAQLRPIMPSDVDAVITIGRRIWYEHYVPIVGQALVDYMTAQRFTPEYVSRYLGSSDESDDEPSACWLDLLEVDGNVVGYCSYSLCDRPDELKLEQLYLLPELHGQGLGGMMMRHVEAHALSLGRIILWLQVNKRNSASIRVYEKTGFTVREEAVFDIGNGFLMDDYIMEKRLK